jgi:hypothetical protein
MVPFISLVGIPKHVVTTISAFSFTMLLLDIILTHIVNHMAIHLIIYSIVLPRWICLQCKTQLDNMHCGYFLSAGSMAGQYDQREVRGAGKVANEKYTYALDRDDFGRHF